MDNANEMSSLMTVNKYLLEKLAEKNVIISEKNKLIDRLMLSMTSDEIVALVKSTKDE